nr:unnamed protein product [Callosobruchus analis]
MALSPQFRSLGELYEKEVEGIDDDEVLIRLKRLAAEFLPEGWKDWRVDIFLNEPEVDPQLINKIRFALPTVGIALAFDCKAISLGEKSYRDMKKMLGWDFCRGLVYSPPHFAVQARGSQIQHQLIVQSIGSLKEQFLSRKDASLELAGGSKGGSQRSMSGGSTSHNSDGKSLEMRIGALEKNFETSQNLLERILMQVSGDRPEEEEDEEGSYDEEEMEDWDENLLNPEETEVKSVSSWKAPTLVSDKNVEANACSFDFTPAIKEQEPTIPEPEPEIRRQGIECQSKTNRVLRDHMGSYRKCKVDLHREAETVKDKDHSASEQKKWDLERIQIDSRQPELCVFRRASGSLALSMDTVQSKTPCEVS